jgi:exonuclease SbcC
MPITVRVQNVQSVEDATIVIEGFTVISGPNNSGKTAVLRAIKGAFTNAPAGSLVRHGADHLTVDIDFGDGNTLCWKKGAKINQYTVNGKVLDNVGRGVPAEVEALGIRYMQAGTEKVWPQIAEQFTGVLFLVGSTGSTVAEAIADVDRVGRLSSALKLAESDRRTTGSTLKVRRSDVESLEKELGAFVGLDGVATRTSSLEARVAQAETTRLAVQNLAAVRNRLQGSREQVKSLSGVTGILVPSQDRVAEGSRAGEAVREAEGLRDRFQTAQGEVSRWEGVETITLPDEALVTESGKAKKERATLLLLQSRQTQAQRVVEALGGVLDVSLPSDSAGEKARKTKEALAILTGIRKRLSQAQANVQTLGEQLETTAGELGQQQVEVDHLLGDRGLCPTCGRVVEGEHSHEGAA